MNVPFADQLRAIFKPVSSLDAAMDKALSNLGAVAFVPSGASGGFPDAGDTDDPLVEELGRRVEAAGRG